MINKLLYKITSWLPCRLIKNDDGQPYLERYYVGSFAGATFYLHRFVSSDRERHVHNHPWHWGRAIVLAGGYKEEVVLDLCPDATTPTGSGCLTHTRTVCWYNRVNGCDFHRISDAKPGTWTLFFHGPRAYVRKGACSVLKGWGFLEREGHRTVFRPFESAGSKWWVDARVGAAAGREPLRK